MKITLLNTSILTAYGTFEYQLVSLDEAKRLVKKFGFISAIGHAATADILSELLEAEIPANRIEFVQSIDDTALIFKLNSRIPEGKVLNKAEIGQIGYQFGILRRLK